MRQPLWFDKFLTIISIPKKVPDTICHITSNNYPINLKEISAAPPRLFIRGTVQTEDSRAVAIVGSRKMTDYGKATAWRFAKYLATCSITIVSGLARGIDSVAHRAALSTKNGRTIAVLGHGLDRIYPPENQELASQIAHHGALVTEFPARTLPHGKNFLVRNRIVSGLSLGVLVVEGARRSGTLSIANWAANQNREVFAIPGRVDSPMSFLPNKLIEQGAIPVTQPRDILDYLNLKA